MDIQGTVVDKPRAILRARTEEAMTRQEWWRYVREDKIGLWMIVLVLGGLAWAIASGHLP